MSWSWGRSALLDDLCPLAAGFVAAGVGEIGRPRTLDSFDA
jgi:hypothetical protein